MGSIPTPGTTSCENGLSATADQPVAENSVEGYPSCGFDFHAGHHELRVTDFPPQRISLWLKTPLRVTPHVGSIPTPGDI